MFALLTNQQSLVLLLIAVVIGAFAALLVKVTAFCEDDTNQADHAEVHVYDWTYRDDHGNTYVVTAASVNDALDLLHEDHGLTYRYINQSTFLAHQKRVF